MTAERSTVIRARTDGFLQEVHCRPGDMVHTGQKLATMNHSAVTLANRIENLKVVRLSRQVSLALQNDVTEAVRNASQLAVHHDHRQRTCRELERLVVRSEHVGTVADVVPHESLGTMLRIGDPIATVVHGDTLIEAWLRQDDLANARLKVGTEVNFRCVDHFEKLQRGRVVSIDPGNNEEFTDLALTTAGGGTIVLDPVTGRPTSPVFRVRIRGDRESGKTSVQDGRVVVMLPRKYESIAHWVLRHLYQAIEQINTE